MAFKSWQVKAGFDRLYPLHALRHTAVTNVYRASRDLFLAQRFARHVSPLTTIVYTHPSDEVTCPYWLYHFLCLGDQRLDRLRSRRPVAQRTVWPLAIVELPPSLDDHLSFFQGVEQLSVQQLVT